MKSRNPKLTKFQVTFDSNNAYSSFNTTAFLSMLNKYNISSRRKLYDSGCSRNMFNSTADFSSLSTNTKNEEISLADGSNIYSKGVGISPLYGKTLYVPDLTRSLIYTPQLIQIVIDLFLCGLNSSGKAKILI